MQKSMLTSIFGTSYGLMTDWGLFTPMKQLTDIQKERLFKAIKYLALAIATAIAMALGLTSCNVTRTITTESRSLTRGDTAVIIQSKTIESYNAKKN